MVSAAEAHDRRDQHRTFIRAAARAGVGHVVYTSFAGAAADATFTLGRDHFDAESAIRETGMAWTFLRDNFYLDVLPLLRRPRRRDPRAGRRRPGRRGGPGRRRRRRRGGAARPGRARGRDVHARPGRRRSPSHEVAARAGAVLGRGCASRTRRSRRPTPRARAAYDAERWQLDAWVSTYTAIADGSVAEVTDDVRRVTGRAPARWRTRWALSPVGAQAVRWWT